MTAAHNVILNAVKDLSPIRFISPQINPVNRVGIAILLVLKKFK